MLPNSSSVPIAKRIRQAFGDKLPLFTSGTQRGTLTDSHTLLCCFVFLHRVASKLRLKIVFFRFSYQTSDWVASFTQDGILKRRSCSDGEEKLRNLSRTEYTSWKIRSPHHCLVAGSATNEQSETVWSCVVPPTHTNLHSETLKLFFFFLHFFELSLNPCRFPRSSHSLETPPTHCSAYTWRNVNVRSSSVWMNFT